MKSLTSPVVVRLSPELKKAIAKLAKDEGRSMGAQIAHMVRGLVQNG